VGARPPPELAHARSDSVKGDGEGCDGCTDGSPSLSRLGVTCRLQERNYQTKDR
jgi:hypothetical protein